MRNVRVAIKSAGLFGFLLILFGACNGHSQQMRVQPLGPLNRVLSTFARIAAQAGSEMERQGNWAGAELEYQEAIGQARGSIRSYPTPEEYLVLASALIDHQRMLSAQGKAAATSANELAQAEASLRQGLQLDQQLSQGAMAWLFYYELGTVYTLQGNLDAARAEYAETLRLQPGYKLAIDSLLYLDYLQRRIPASTLDNNHLPIPTTSPPPILTQQRVAEYIATTAVLVLPQPLLKLLVMVHDDANKFRERLNR